MVGAAARRSAPGLGGRAGRFGTSGPARTRRRWSRRCGQGAQGARRAKGLQGPQGVSALAKAAGRTCPVNTQLQGFTADGHALCAVAGTVERPHDVPGIDRRRGRQLVAHDQRRTTSSDVSAGLGVRPTARLDVQEGRPRASRSGWWPSSRAPAVVSTCDDSVFGALPRRSSPVSSRSRRASAVTLAAGSRPCSSFLDLAAASLGTTAPGRAFRRGYSSCTTTRAATAPAVARASSARSRTSEMPSTRKIAAMARHAQ